MFGSDFSGLTWPAIASGILLVLFVLWSRRGRGSRGKPLPLRVFLGMLFGRAESWEEFRALFNQPPPPPEASKLEAIQQILAGSKPKGGNTS